jgi:hypothetical protein
LEQIVQRKQVAGYSFGGESLSVVIQKLFLSVVIPAPRKIVASAKLSRERKKLKNFSLYSNHNISSQQELSLSISVSMIETTFRGKWKTKHRPVDIRFLLGTEKTTIAKMVINIEASVEEIHHSTGLKPDTVRK